eukprot:gnl/TRDRNA2_/TRDRNA2_171957_c0_seq2.p1 gnl/TRDRNA2_/TRDRNA2_171957_c0~~gnl/TRDRNA2_/TRDRNA2_171957_c0_seq2.p1  ORF type:complete len:332 (+),score=67.87 gnl/TRDRNA2_/TRDRNA2_171957_c0_seq2:99-1094(+)
MAFPFSDDEESESEGDSEGILSTRDKEVEELVCWKPPTSRASGVPWELGNGAGGLARMVAWPRGASKPVPSLPWKFSSVCVFGPHHSCTNALNRELLRFFQLQTVENMLDDIMDPLWKHRVFERCPPPELRRDTLCICLVKDPAFWIQSLARDPVAGSFYDVVPIRLAGRKGGELELRPLKPKCTDQLFGPISFDDVLFKDAIELWEATVGSYFDEAVFPLVQTVVIRCEDFQFRFAEVILSLSRRGLPLKPNVDSRTITPVDVTAKVQRHPAGSRRNRSELLAYYADGENRFKGFSSAQVARLRSVDPAIAVPLGYSCGDDDATAVSWLP